MENAQKGLPQSPIPSENKWVKYGRGVVLAALAIGLNACQPDIPGYQDTSETVQLESVETIRTVGFGVGMMLDSKIEIKVGETYEIDDRWSKNSIYATVTSIKQSKDGEIFVTFDESTGLVSRRNWDGSTRKGVIVPLSDFRVYRMGNTPVNRLREFFAPEDGEVKFDDLR